MNANQGLARRAVLAYCVGALFLALVATFATTVIEAQSGETPEAEVAKGEAVAEKSDAAPANDPASATDKAAAEKNADQNDTELGPLNVDLAADTKTPPPADKAAATKTAPNKAEQPSSGKDKADTKKKPDAAATKAEPAKPADPLARSLDGVNLELAKALRRKGSLTLQNTTLKEALFAINEIWKVNIVVAQNVNGTVDATFKDTPLYEILDNILTVNGYGYRISGQTLTVGAKQDTGLNPLFETAIIELEAANPKEVFEYVKHKLSHDGEIKELASSQSLMITDFPERIANVTALAKQFDEAVMTRKGIKPGKKKKPGETETTEPATPEATANNPANNTPKAPVLDPKDMRVAQIALKNSKVQQILQSVETLRSRDGKITPMTAENKLVIVDYPDKIKAIEEFIEEFESTSSEPKREQFQLKYKKVGTIADTVRAMMSTEGKITVFETENRLMIVDHPKNLAEIQQLIKEVDNENAAVTVQQFSPKHVKVNTLGETIQSMLSREGKFSMVEVENSLIVIDYPNVIERVQELITKVDREERGSKVAQFTLQFVRPSSLEQSVRSLLTKDGKITINDVANQMTVEDYPYVITKVEQLIQQSDVDGTMPQLFKFRPQYLEAAQLQEVITNMLTRDGRVSTIEGENQVLIFDYPWNIERLKRALNEMDTMRPQVRITVLIYDMSIEDTLKLGLNWQSNVKGSGGQKSFRIDSIQSAVPTITGGAASTTPAGVVTFSSLTQALDFSTIVNAMSTAKNSRLLADPNLTVVDRRKGSIEVKQRIPIQQLTQTGGGAGATGGAIGTTSFVEAGIKMEVTPRISADRNIEMAVKPEYSRLVGYTPGPPAQPIIESRIAETTVWVAERQTLVIGGLRQKTEIHETRGLPYLKDIKRFHLNRLFSYEETEFRESELVVFINPEIVEPTYAGREREQAITGYAYPSLDTIPVPEGTPGASCPPGMPYEQPVPAAAPMGPEQLPTPPGDASARKSATPNNKLATAPNKQFNDGYGQNWGRSPQERSKIPSQSEVLYGAKPATNNVAQSNLARPVAAPTPTATRTAAAPQPVNSLPVVSNPIARTGPAPVSVASLPPKATTAVADASAVATTPTRLPSVNDNAANEAVAEATQTTSRRKPTTSAETPAKKPATTSPTSPTSPPPVHFEPAPQDKVNFETTRANAASSVNRTAAKSTSVAQPTPISVTLNPRMRVLGQPRPGDSPATDNPNARLADLPTSGVR